MLLTARNETGGVRVQLFHGANSEQELPYYEQREIPGAYLSPECGDSFRRCSEITVLSTADLATPATSEVEEEILLALLPLDRALGLLVFSVGHLSASELHFIDLTQRNCSPAEVIRITSGDYYIVCSNREVGSVTLLNLNLDIENVAESYIPELDYLLFRLRNVTNFLYVELPDSSGHYIYFASGYNVLYIKPLHLTDGSLDIGLENRRCLVKKLGYTTNWELVVHCSDNRAMYVNIKSEYVSTETDYAKEGLPYLCPDHNVYLGVFSGPKAGFIQYGNRSTLDAKNFDVPMSSYVSGVCLGSGNVTFFAFTDREMGTRLLRANPSKGFVTSLSDSVCINTPCLPLVVLNNDRYLALREMKHGDWLITLFDSHTNFSVTLEVPHSQADMMAVVEHVAHTSPSVTDLPREILTEEATSAGRTGGLKPSTAPKELFVLIPFACICIAIGAIVFCVLWR